MTVVQAIVLGVVQGLTEFIPISSSGHLILVPWLFHWTFLLRHPDVNKTFDVALHLGTFVGAAAYFRNDLITYVRAFFTSVFARAVRTVDERLAWLLVLSSIPGAVAGAFGEKVIETHFGQPWLIGVCLAVFGVVLFFVDRLATRERRVEEINAGDGISMGIAQALALSPGVSRSGITITVGRLRGLSREAAVRFSFLMSLPIIFGAVVYKGVKVAAHGLPAGTATPFAWGVAASGVSGFLAIWATLRYVRTHTFNVFVVYRLVAAAAIFALILTGTRPAGA